METAPTYYHSCACGKAGDTTFEYGDKLLVSDGLLYTPTSLTVTLFDAENSVYGFTYNSVKAPLLPVI